MFQFFLDFQSIEEKKCLIRNSNNYISEENDLGHERHKSFTRDLSKGLSNADIAAKFFIPKLFFFLIKIRMRDLERKFLDLAGSLDRKIQGFIDENPLKFLRHLRVEFKNGMGIIIIERTLKKQRLHYGRKISKDSNYSKTDSSHSSLP